MRWTYVLVFTFAFRSALAALKLPTYITACSRNDPNLDDCVVRQGSAAIPHFLHGDKKYKVPDLDPLDIEELSVRQGTKQVGLFLVIRKIKMYGMGNAEFTKSRTDLKKRHIEWDFINTKGLQIIGDYNISGQVLLLPIVGAGKANITITGLKITYKFDFDLIKKKDGKEYMNATTSQLLFDIGNAYFQLDNLFNGDRLLGVAIPLPAPPIRAMPTQPRHTWIPLPAPPIRAMQQQVHSTTIPTSQVNDHNGDNTNRFLNENWKELTQEFGPAVGDALGEVFRRLLASILGLVPFDEVHPV